MCSFSGLGSFAGTRALKVSRGREHDLIGDSVGRGALRRRRGLQLAARRIAHRWGAYGGDVEAVSGEIRAKHKVIESTKVLVEQLYFGKYGN